MVRDGVFGEYDYEAIKVLDDFLPDKMFDVHAHLYDKDFVWDAPRQSYTFDDYLKEMGPLFGNNRMVRINAITMPHKSMADLGSGSRDKSTAFLVKELDKNPMLVGEVMSLPTDTPEDLEKLLVHPNIKGFKCYHQMANKDVTWDCDIGEYLPESAWQVANERGMCITLHMVKNKALSDPENLNYIITMAKRYPNAVLILAHAARGFASWTTVDTVEKLAKLDNVWFDLAAVCESPAMFQIIKKTGTQRCMWGSDYPISMMAGKAISLGSGFYWIYEKDLDNLQPIPSLMPWMVGTENLMAVRQMCLMADLGRKDIEDIFYNNAVRLFFK